MARRARKKSLGDDLTDGVIGVERREPGHYSAAVAAMREARTKPRRITAADLIPPEVHQHYEQRWQVEDAALLAAEAHSHAHKSQPLLVLRAISRSWPCLIGGALFAVVAFLLVH